MKDELKKIYATALNKLTRKDLSVYQMKTYLQEKVDDKDLVDDVISLLIDRRFLNDKRLIDEVITSLRSKGYGQYRIEKNLEKYQFDSQLVNSYLMDVSVKSLSDLDQAIKQIDVISYRGSKKQVVKKIQDKLIRKGFSISQVTTSVSDDIIDYDEFDSCLLDVYKLFKHESDEYIIKNKLYQKGYQKQTILNALERREANEDK
ncbi:MAG: hypothetical protein GXY98_01900 [Erysipelothrix sp.]|nr:hypothetical protein [Erysipelothrix sp.]